VCLVTDSIHRTTHASAASQVMEATGDLWMDQGAHAPCALPCMRTTLQGEATLDKAAPTSGRMASDHM
jgi:hypothetical protein